MNGGQLISCDDEILERLVDIAASRRETPYRVRQIGTVTQRPPTAHETRGLSNHIRWESGALEDVRLDLAPPEFASLLPGRRFEAIVLRDSATDFLLRILDLVPLAALPTQLEIDALLDSVPSSNNLPAQDWEKYD